MKMIQHAQQGVYTGQAAGAKEHERAPAEPVHCVDGHKGENEVYATGDYDVEKDVGHFVTRS